MKKLLEDDAVATFANDGVVIIRGLFGDWVETLRTGIEKNIASPGSFVRDYDNENNSGKNRFFTDYCNWDRIDEYREFLFDSPSADVAGQLMGSNQVRLFHEHVLVKEPDTDIPTPWHHDQPYYCVNGKQTCSLWLALDAVPKETSPEFIAGSHRWGKWFRPERFNKTPLYENDGFEAMPDIDSSREEYDIRSWSVEPGDVVAFNYLTVHGAPANRSATTRRRAFSSRWVGDDATFAVRKGNTSPPFPDCKLKHGEPLSGNEFPVVRTSS